MPVGKDDTGHQSTLDASGAGEHKKENHQQSVLSHHAPSKIVIRRLPPTLTPEEFLEQVSPLPDYDFFYFVRADMSLGQHAFTRAYINFLSPDDIFIFRDKFDGYVFLDAKGGEYPAIVEFASFQKVPKKKTKKLDTKIGLIDQDSDYKKFLESLSKPQESSPVSLDAMVAEVETKENNIAKLGSTRVTTPLLEYLRKRREERKLNIAKLKEERRRGVGNLRDRDRDLDRKRPGKDDLDKRKSSLKDGLRDRNRRRDRVRIREKDRKRDRDSLRPEKVKDTKSGEKRWQKDTEVPPRHTVMLLRNTERDGHPSEKNVSGNIPVEEWNKKEEIGERDAAHDNLSENEQGKGGNERRKDDRRGIREGKWGDTAGRDDDRGLHYGGKERGRGSEDDRFRDKLNREKTGRGYRDEEAMKRSRYAEDRGGSDRYSFRDRGGSLRARSDRNGGYGCVMRDKYDDRRSGGSDGWRKKESEFDKKKPDKERAPDRRLDAGRSKGKDEGRKDREDTLTSVTDACRDDKDKQKEEGKSGRGVDWSEAMCKVEANSRSHTDSSESALPTYNQTKEETEEGGGSTDAEEKKRKRKERPERQIYIPRKALERSKQGSPHLTGKTSDDKTLEPS
ncbi:hypothetical protein BsWGS_09667 [Bradybaena similaris]